MLLARQPWRCPSPSGPGAGGALDGRVLVLLLAGSGGPRRAHARPCGADRGLTRRTAGHGDTPARAREPSHVISLATAPREASLRPRSIPSLVAAHLRGLDPEAISKDGTSQTAVIAGRACTARTGWQRRNEGGGGDRRGPLCRRTTARAWRRRRTRRSTRTRGRRQRASARPRTRASSSPAITSSPISFFRR